MAEKEKIFPYGEPCRKYVRYAGRDFIRGIPVKNTARRIAAGMRTAMAEGHLAGE